MSLGIWQILLILLLVLILFGAGKLPRVMGDVAKGIKNFKSGLKDEDEEPENTKAIDHEPVQAAQTVKHEPVQTAQTVKKDETIKSS